MPKKKCPFCENKYISYISTVKTFGKRRTRIYKCPDCNIIHYDLDKKLYVKGPYVHKSKLLEKWRQKKGNSVGLAM